MTIQRLSKLADWKLKHKHQDIRGQELCRRSGECLGTIIDMVVDTDTRIVTSVVLEDGRHYATEDIIDENGQIILEPHATKLAEPPARAPGAHRPSRPMDRP
ncbi:PRC-barrel domain containing protein [Persicimonas caeni]|uniref:PRC-barrel domain containing protein n=1 Tax=Persicimonas caeni TaxID=2292766 RepID=A0A4Y6PZ63_PERCE|nr:PRC-barrel domain-containing protein [Persicimonas caeni]QDG53530.1 PRC-barrel domain containing protein [Persicimonas caeni]QED34751.1 PRC-barrel domain containing protein [Persicimonas caeni]